VRDGVRPLGRDQSFLTGAAQPGSG
jgi:hypothetical protein